MPISNIGLQEIHLDISTKLRQKTFYANEVDTEGRGLHAFLQDNGVKVDGTGVTMQFRYKSLNDGESKVYDFTPIGDPTNGEFEIHYPTEMVRGHGNKLFPCTIVANDPTSELAFENVFVYVNKAEVNTEGIEASNEHSLLKQSLDKVDTWDATFETKYTGLETEYATELTGVKSQLAEKATIKNNTETYIPIGGITPKAIYNTGGHIFVVSQKPNGNGYIRCRMRNDVVDTSPTSVGGNSQLLRVMEILNATECFSLQYTDSANSDAVTWASATAPYGAITLNLRSRSTAVAGAWIEYDVTVPKGIYSIEALIYGSTGSSQNLTIAIDGVDKMTGVSFYKSSAQFFRLDIPITPGTHKIRFTTVTATYMSIAGVNVVDLNNFKKGYNFDKMITVYQGSSNQYITSGGAIDYAMLDADTNLYCGSYHGGETRSRIAYILDGTSITLNDGQVYIGKILEIEQDTNIVNKLNAYSRYIFKLDGSVEFEVYFSGNINLTRLFTNMTTSHVDFTQVIYPKKVDASADGTYYMPLGSNYVVQKNPTNNQKIITVMNDNIFPVGVSILPYVQTSQYYKKLYKENIKSDIPINFTEGNFKSVHVFE